MFRNIGISILKLIQTIDGNNELYPNMYISFFDLAAHSNSKKKIHFPLLCLIIPRGQRLTQSEDEKHKV